MRLRDGTAAEVGVSEERTQSIRDRAQSWVSEGIHPALVILAARQGVIFLHEAYGQLGPGDDSPPVALNSIFPVASLTKLLTASVAMTLVERGLLGLNRPVAEYIPEFQGEGKDRILVRHLMTHTSGIRDGDVLELCKLNYPDKGEFSLSYLIRDNIEAYIELVAGTTPHRVPDSLMVYSNLNYELLARIISRVSGESIDQLTIKRIFSPLKMEDSHHVPPASLLNRTVSRTSHAPYYEHLKVLMKGASGSSGVYSTAQDLAIFGQMILNQGEYDGAKILNAASVRAMTRNQIPGIGARLDDEVFPHAYWGLGWSINAPFKGTLYGEHMLSGSAFGHGGAGGVFIWVDPIYEIVAAYFSVLPDEEHLPTKGCADLFINMVLASIEEF